VPFVPKIVAMAGSSSVRPSPASATLGSGAHLQHGRSPLVPPGIAREAGPSWAE
jgi:hypothetical protein